MKKKILVIISIALIACTLVACGNKKDNDNKSDSSNKTQSEGTNKEDDTALKDKEKNKEDKDTKASELEQSASGETNKENKDNTTSQEKPAMEDQDKITSPQPPATAGQNNNTIPKPPTTGGNNTPPPSQATGTTEKDYRIFYYDFPNERMVYIDKKVKVTDGAVVNALTNELKNNNNNDGLFTLDPGTAVTSAKLDRDNDVLKVYFNESLNNSMNLGTKSQCELVNSIVYTYGYNYGVSKVAIYVNGEPFIDPRGSKPDGYYTVDTSGATEFGK